MAKKKNTGRPAPKPTQQKQSGSNENAENGDRQSKLLDLLKRRKELETEILALKKQIFTEDKNDAEQIDKINRFEGKRVKLTKEYFDLLEKIAKIRKDEREELVKIEKLEIDKQKRQKEEEKRIKSIQEHHEEIGDLQERAQVLMRSLSEEAQKQATSLGLTASNAKTLAEEIKDANIQITDSAQINKSFEKSMTSVMNIAKEMDALEGRIAENMQNSVDGQSKSLDLYETERNLKMAMAQLDLNANKLGVERYMALKKTTDSFEGQFKRITKVNNALKDQSKIVAKNKKDTASASSPSDVKSMESNADKMGTSMGDRFNRAMERGASKVGGWVDTIANKIRGAMEWAVDKIKNGIKTVFSAVWDFVSKIFSIFYDSVMDLDKRAAETSRIFGVNRKMAFDMEKSFAKMALSANIIGQNSEQYRETTSFLADTYGLGVETLMGGDAQIGIIKNMTTLREQFQLTNDEAKNLFEFSVLTGTSMDKLAQVTDKMSGGIMQTQQALKAMANVPKIMQLNIKTGLAGLAAFAAKAKLMGVDFGKIQQMQDSMLDIESSLGKQFESTAITGIHIGDMDKIRAAALYGETDKMFDLIMKNIGTVDQFKGLRGGVIGQKAFAGQFEMSREEMIEMLTRGEMLKKLGLSFEKAARLQAKNEKELRAIAEQERKAGNINRANFIDNIANEKKHAEIMTKINDKIEKMKMQFAPAASRILDLIHKILDRLLNSPIFDKIMQFMNNAVEKFVKNLDDFLSGKISFKDLFSGVDFGLGALFKEIFNDPAIKEFANSLGLDKINISLKGLKETLAGIEEKLGVVTWLFDNWGKVLGVVSALILTKFIGMGGLFKMAVGAGVLAGAMYFLTDSFERLAKVNADNLKNVGIIMGVMLGGLVGLGALTGQFPQIILGIVIIVASFRLLVGAMLALAEVADKLKPVFDFLLELGKLILQHFKQMQDLVYNLVKLLADFLIEAVKQVGILVVNVLTAIGDNMVKIISKIQQAAETLIPIFRDAIVALLNSVGQAFKVVFDSIFGGITAVIEKALTKVNEVIYVIKDSIVAVIESVKSAIDTLAGAFIRVLDKVIELVKSNPGNIVKIAEAMASIAWSLGKMSSGIFGSSGSKFAEFMEIVHVADPGRIQAVANSIRMLTQAIRELNGAMGNFNTNKLNMVVSKTQNTTPIRPGGTSIWGDFKSGISNLWNSATSFLSGGSQQKSTKMTSPQRSFSVASSPGQAQQQQYTQTQTTNPSTKEMEKKLDTIIKILSSQSTQTAQIRFGEKFVEEVKVQLGRISDVDGNIDSARGRFIK
jgi:hypothetical protein